MSVSSWTFVCLCLQKKRKPLPKMPQWRSKGWKLWPWKAVSGSFGSSASWWVDGQCSTADVFVFILDAKEPKAKAVPAQTGTARFKCVQYFLSHSSTDLYLTICRIDCSGSCFSQKRLPRQGEGQSCAAEERYTLLLLLNACCQNTRAKIKEKS